MGIPKDRIGILFEKFSRIEASTTRRFGGAGLGLAISRQLAEIMGGEMGVNRDEGKGSEFWFTVRLARATPQESQSHTFRNGEGGRGAGYVRRR